MQAGWSRRTVAAYLGVFLLALGVRLVCLWQSLDNPSFDAPIVDAGEYDAMARRLAAGLEAGPRLFWQPFFYPVYLAAVYALSAGSILAAKLSQAVLGALTCCLTLALGSRLVDRRTGLAAAVMTALYGPLVLFEGELLATGWAAFWSVALVLAFVAAPGRARPVFCFALGLLGALAVLTRPTFLPFYAAAWVWLLVAERRRAGSWSRPALGLFAALLGFAVLAVPVAELSRRATGSFSFLAASGGLNLYIGNNPSSCETLTARPGLEWGELVDLPARQGHTGMAARNRFFLARVGEFAAERPGAFLGGLGGKALRFAGSRELPRNLDVYFAAGWSGLLSLLTWKAGGFGFPFGVLLPLAAVGLVFRRERFPAPVWLFLTLYPLAVILVFVAARYRAPVIPVLAVAAAAGLFALLEIARRRQPRRALAAALLLLGVVLLSTLPGPFCEEGIDGEADFYYCLGHAQSERGDADAAAASYERALAADPDLEQVHYNLGLLRSEAGDLERAEHHYGAALRIAPGFARAHNNLGSLLERRGRSDEAVPHFAEAARLDPRLLVARRNLAKALLRGGRSAEAVAAIRGVIEAEPGQAEDHFVLGSAQLQGGDPESAVAQLRHAVELGGDARVHNELGVALLGLGDPTAAVEQFRRAVELSPDYLDAYSNAGAALAMRGDFAEARRLLAAAVRRSPESADARYNLAIILERLGEADAAIAELRAVLALRPDHARARARLRELADE